jgi:archaellum biogenesis protein FlaJ (TadC family)
MANIYDRSYEIFKPVIDRTKYIFAPLDQKLKMARIKTSYEKYGAFIFLMSSIVFTCAFVFISLFGSLILGTNLINFLIYTILSVFLGVATALFFYFYPNFRITEFRGKVDNSLPFVTIYLSTIMRSGLPPQEMFKLLGKFKQYKTVAREARKINSDVKYLGLDLPKALDKAIARSPSPDWSELLAGIRNSITVGGDTGKYLDEKAKGFIQKYKRRLADFSKMIALFMNVYITVVIVGLVFFIVISSLMVTIGGMSVSMIKFMQYVIVFIGLPVITGVFITLIKSASPWGVED